MMSGEFVRQTERTESTPTKESRYTEQCTECQSEKLRRDEVRGEIVCDECGYIVSKDLIDRGAEWTAFTQKEREEQSRVGSPLSETLHDKGLTTEIHWQNVDAHGQSLTPSKRRQIERLRRWQKRMRTEGSGEQNLQIALVEIHRMASALGLPKPTREVAAVIYRQALDEDLIQGRSIEAVAASALYIASRKENIPRSLDEFETVARIERIEIARSYRYLAAELDLEMAPIDPKLFVPRFCSKLELAKPIQRTAIDILEAGEQEGLHSGKSPTGLAAAAIYTASIQHGEDRTQHEVAEAAGVTAVTVRNRYQEQQSLLDASD
jgi:transcription initiation factor TFIIB